MTRLPLSRMYAFVRKEQQKSIEAYYEERGKATNENLGKFEREQANSIACIHYGEVMAYETVLRKIEELGEERE